MNRSDRKSRWGRQGDNNDNNPRGRPAVSVSDDDAMRALLFSAETRSNEQERDRRKGNFNSSRRQENRGVSGRGGSRWGSKGKHVDKKEDSYSYYGRERSTINKHGDSSSSKNNGGNRKRKLPGLDDDRTNETTQKEMTAKTSIKCDNSDFQQLPQNKPNFGLSGALAKDAETGSLYKGFVLKFKEPPEARAPNARWRLYVFKPSVQEDNKAADSDLIETLHISKQSAYLFGGNKEIADICILHPSSSSQHAVLQFRAMPTQPSTPGLDGPRLSCQPYIMDLESTNGTFLNKVKIDPARYYQLKKGDVLSFGASTREYVLLTENTTSVK